MSAPILNWKKYSTPSTPRPTSLWDHWSSLLKLKFNQHSKFIPGFNLGITLQGRRNWGCYSTPNFFQLSIGALIIAPPTFLWVQYRLAPPIFHTFRRAWWASKQQELSHYLNVPIVWLWACWDNIKLRSSRSLENSQSWQIFVKMVLSKLLFGFLRFYRLIPFSYFS